MPSAYAANRSLVLRYQAGDAGASEALLRLNERLIYAIAARYHADGWEVEDLAQEGRLALLHAARRFDPERGTQFSTYAVFWVRQAIARAAQRGGLIAWPYHVTERARKAAHSADPKEQAWAARLRAVTASLDAPVDEENPLADFQEAPVDVEREVLGRLHVAELLARLEPRERFILTRRLDLDGGGVDTLAEVAAAIGRSREGVRTAEARTLARLREHVAGSL